MKVTRITYTPDGESLMAYIARVSNPANQENPSFEKLLRYCIEHHHWSVFEHAHMTLEIETTRGLAAQILRHRSFTFQEFSQRYADTNAIGAPEMFELRRQDTKNRQNSTDDLDEDTKRQFTQLIESHFQTANAIYKHMLDAGIAKECARFILPLSTPTRLYMTGNVRSWIHYINLRSANGTQKEHMDIANEAKKIFKETFPTIALALNY